MIYVVLKTNENKTFLRAYHIVSSLAQVITFTASMRLMQKVGAKPIEMFSYVDLLRKFHMHFHLSNFVRLPKASLGPLILPSSPFRFSPHDALRTTQQGTDFSHVLT